DSWSYKRPELIGNYQGLKINVYSRQSICSDIKNELGHVEGALTAFHGSVFGPFLQFDDKASVSAKAMHGVLSREVTRVGQKPNEMWFRIGNHFTRFSAYEYAVVTVCPIFVSFLVIILPFFFPRIEPYPVDPLAHKPLQPTLSERLLFRMVQHIHPITSSSEIPSVLASLPMIEPSSITVLSSLSFLFSSLNIISFLHVLRYELLQISDPYHPLNLILKLLAVVRP
ncbi:Domain of unknown function (DUF1985, partial [Striga hermonthica]